MIMQNQKITLAVGLRKPMKTYTRTKPSDPESHFTVSKQNWLYKYVVFYEN